MKCPKCTGVELRGGGSFSSPGNRAGSCPSCGGIWIQSNDFSAIADHFGDSPTDSSESEEKNDADSRTGLCPEGHGIMIRAKVPLEPAFYLEKCGACGGIWFDRGELSRVLENDLISNLSVIWTMAWQRRQHQQEGLEQYRRIQKEKLGEEIYEQIVRLAKKLKDHPHKIRGISLLYHELETGPGKSSPS